MYIHLLRYDHILHCVMKTFSTPASSILAIMASKLSYCGRPPMAFSMRQMSSPFFASFQLGDKLRRGDVVHEVDRFDSSRISYSPITEH